MSQSAPNSIEGVFFSKNNFNTIQELVRKRVQATTGFDINKDTRFNQDIVNIMKSVYLNRNTLQIPQGARPIDAVSAMTKAVLNGAQSYIVGQISKSNAGPAKRPETTADFPAAIQPPRRVAETVPMMSDQAVLPARLGARPENTLLSKHTLPDINKAMDTFNKQRNSEIAAMSAVNPHNPFPGPTMNSSMAPGSLGPGVPLPPTMDDLNRSYNDSYRNQHENFTNPSGEPVPTLGSTRISNAFDPEEMRSDYQDLNEPQGPMFQMPDMHMSVTQPLDFHNQPVAQKPIGVGQGAYMIPGQQVPNQAPVNQLTTMSAPPYIQPAPQVNANEVPYNPTMRGVMTGSQQVPPQLPMDAIQLQGTAPPPVQNTLGFLTPASDAALPSLDNQFGLITSQFEEASVAKQFEASAIDKGTYARLLEERMKERASMDATPVPAKPSQVSGVQGIMPAAAPNSLHPPAWVPTSAASSSVASVNGQAIEHMSGPNGFTPAPLATKQQGATMDMSAAELARTRGVVETFTGPNGATPEPLSKIGSTMEADQQQIATLRKIDHFMTALENSRIDKLFASLSDFANIIERQKEQKVYKRKYSMLINSGNRDLSNLNFSKYNFRIEFSPGSDITTTNVFGNNLGQASNFTRTSGNFVSTGAKNPYIDRVFRNVTCLRLKRVCIPVPSNLQNFYPEPYYLVSIEELDSNVLTSTTNTRVFCKVHFDKRVDFGAYNTYQTQDQMYDISSIDLNSVGFKALSDDYRSMMYYLSDDCEFREFYPVPLAKLDRMTIKLLRPNGEPVGEFISDQDVFRLYTAPSATSVTIDNGSGPAPNLGLNNFTKGDEIKLVAPNNQSYDTRVSSFGAGGATLNFAAPNNNLPEPTDYTNGVVVNMTNQISYYFEVTIEEYDQNYPVRPDPVY
jgi:hypothetical protein